MNPEVKKIFVLFNEVIIRIGTEYVGIVLRMKNVICLYMTMMKFYSNPKVVPFRSEATSIGMKQR